MDVEQGLWLVVEVMKEVAMASEFLNRGTPRGGVIAMTVRVLHPLYIGDDR